MKKPIKSKCKHEWRQLLVFGATGQIVVQEDIYIAMNKFYCVKCLEKKNL